MLCIKPCTEAGHVYRCDTTIGDKLKPTDTIQAVMSDLHTGSIHALTLARAWQGEHTQVISPRSKQIEIRKHLDEYTSQIALARKDKKLKLIIDGDAIDGVHHNTQDVFTRDIKEQADVHIEIMIDIQKKMKWQKGDELYYVKGTEIHTTDMEHYIAEELNAVPDRAGNHAHDCLDVETNGIISRFIHHGPGAGDGANEGNAMRNWVKAIYFDAVKDGDAVPDIVYTGHVHNPTYAPYSYRHGMEFKVMHGIILPSWQEKNRYAWMKAPKSKNKIGAVLHEIKADGTICVPKFIVMGYKV